MGTIAVTDESFEKDVLHDVAGVHSPRHGAIQSSLHHSPQRISMPFQQLVDGGSVAGLCRVQQLLSLFRIGKHVASAGLCVADIYAMAATASSTLGSIGHSLSRCVISKTSRQ